MRLYKISLLVLTALVLTQCASGPYVADPPENSSPDVTAAELAYHAQYLSSDALEGRGTGTRANDIAAQYIANEFARYGLEPAGTSGYMQTFEVVTGVELGPDNALAISIGSTQIKAELHKDYIPMAFSASGSAAADIVFAGYGITAPQQNYDDYKDADVKGKFVMAFAGAPEPDDPHAESGMATSIRSKALFAREAGAAALLIVRPDKDELYELRYDNSPSDAGIIVINISRELAGRILAPTGNTVAGIAEDLKKRQRGSEPMNIPGVVAELHAGVQLVRAQTNNVIGLMRGTDPGAKERYLVAGAHYDHLGWGQEGTLYRGEEPMIHNGADDNASGTAGLLELAQYFAAHPPRRSIIFQAYSGEEMGTLGSLHWVNNPTVPLKQIDAMFNLDMIGRLADSTRKLTAQGSGTSPFWKPTLEEMNKKYKFDLAFVPDGRGASDQSNFYMNDIPVLFFFSGLHSEYHRPTDDFETLNVEGMKEITAFVAEMMKKTDDRREQIAFTTVKGAEATQMRSFSIYVGTIPDYGADVVGFKLSGVSPGGPAEKAGMKAGDIMVKFGSTDVKNIYDYMNAMGLYKPGDQIPVVVNRDGQMVTLTVVPTAK